MDDVKDKMKGFFKKVSSSSSSSSGKFKGQGRVLGSAPSSTGPPNPNLARLNLNSNPKPKPNPSSSSSSSSSSFSPSLPQKPPSSDQTKPSTANNPDPNRKPENGFDPYDSLITSGKRSQNGYSLKVFECPICVRGFKTEEEVSIHVESCVNHSSSNKILSVEDGDHAVDDGSSNESRNELEVCVGTFLSGNPKEGSTEVMLKLLGNVVREPDNDKFRKIRMSNPKIREAVGEVAGAVEVLEFAGFELKEDDGEMWAVMEVPDKERIGLISKVIEFLGPRKIVEPLKVGTSKDEAPAETEESVEQKPVDRQIRVFFAVSESIASKIELPDSFYKLSPSELKKEADMRKKKIEESKLLIPKSYREKQAQAARKRYTKTIIRFQFPDGVVLQGVFGPWEQTTALYEFVSSALKEPGLQFDLINPVAIKRRVVPRFPETSQKGTTLEEEDLVPSALIKFRPIETDSLVFTGLCNELLETSEPLE